MKRGLALLIALAVTPASPSVAEPGDCLPDTAQAVALESVPAMRFWVENRDGAVILHADGLIDTGAAERLDPWLGPDIDEVWFNSPGGDMREALLMGRALRRTGLVTRVPADSACVGACAEAFLGGTARMVDPGGRLGFTAVPLSDPASTQTQAQREQAAARWAEERADYYIRAGVSRGLLRLQLDTPAPGICYLSEAGMQRYNVMNPPMFDGAGAL